MGTEHGGFASAMDKESQQGRRGLVYPVDGEGVEGSRQANEGIGEGVFVVRDGV